MTGGTYIGKDMKLHPCECRACERIRYNAEVERLRTAMQEATPSVSIAKPQPGA